MRLHSHPSFSLVCTIVIAMSSLLLASCATTPKEEAYVPPPLTTQEQLITTAGTIDQSLNTLAAVERAKKPQNLSVNAEPNPAPIYPSLSRKVNVNWSGPVEPLLREVAKLTRYRLKVIGNSPAIPVLVTINHDSITAHELIREIHAQAYLRTDIKIFPDSGLIELHYLDK